MGWLFRLFDSILRRDARLSRFLFQKKDFRPAQNSVRHRAFLPPSNHKLSVFGTNGLAEKSIWVIGKRVARERDKTLLARADIARDELAKHQLKLIRAEPPRYHRDIMGWPPHDQKDDIMLIAMELAAVATLTLHIGD